MGILMSIFNFFNTIFKKKQVEKTEQIPTESDVVQRLARLKAGQKVIEKRKRFSYRIGFHSPSFLEDMDNVYDEAYDETWNERHRF